MTQSSPYDIESDEDGIPVPASDYEPETEQVGEELRTESPPAPVDATSPPPRRRGRPRKHVPAPPLSAIVGGAVPGKPLAPPEPPARVLKMAEPGADDSDDPEAWTGDACSVWSSLVKWLGKRGLGPDGITFSVERVPVGPLSRIPVKLQPFSGAAVAGDENLSPGEQRDDYLVNVYHAIYATGGRHGCGPAKYTVRFHYATAGGTLKVSHIVLASYQEIQAQRQHAAAFNTHTASVRGAAGEFSPTSPPVVESRFTPRAQPAQVAPLPPGVDAGLYEELGYLRAQRDENARAAAEGRMPVALPAPGTSQSNAEDEEKRIIRIVQASLAAAGIKPVSEEEKMQRAIAAALDVHTKNIMALYGPPPAAGVGAAGAPPVTPPAAADSVKSTVASLKTLLDELKTLGEAREQFKNALGIEEAEPAETPQ